MAGSSIITESFVWKINKFSTIQQTREQILAQKMEFVMCSSRALEARWTLGFQIKAQAKLKLVLKLQNHNQPSFLEVCGEVLYSKSGNSGTFAKISKTPIAKKLKLNEEIIFSFTKNALVPSSEWARFCDDDGNIYLMIQLKVCVAHGSLSNAWNNFSSMSVSKLQENLANMLKDSKHADMKIVCSDGKEYFTNRLMLSARNPVFESMLSSKMLESETGLVKVEDIGGETMQILLHYFYTGQLLTGWEKPELIQEFMYAAGKYQVLEILTLLDNVIGTDDVPTCNIQLITLSNKLGLKNAEARLTAKVKRLVETASGSGEIVEIIRSTSGHGQFADAEAGFSKIRRLDSTEEASADCSEGIAVVD